MAKKLNQSQRRIPWAVSEEHLKVFYYMGDREIDEDNGQVFN